MAEQEPTLPLGLSKEAIERLRGLDVTIAKARRGVELAKQMGLGTEQIEERLNWADQTRKMLLEEFSG